MRRGNAALRQAPVRTTIAVMAGGPIGAETGGTDGRGRPRRRQTAIQEQASGRRGCRSASVMRRNRAGSTAAARAQSAIWPTLGEIGVGSRYVQKVVTSRGRKRLGGVQRPTKTEVGTACATLGVKPSDAVSLADVVSREWGKFKIRAKTGHIAAGRPKFPSVTESWPCARVGDRDPHRAGQAAGSPRVQKWFRRWLPIGMRVFNELPERGCRLG